MGDEISQQEKGYERRCAFCIQGPAVKRDSGGSLLPTLVGEGTSTHERSQNIPERNGKGECFITQ